MLDFVTQIYDMSEILKFTTCLSAQDTYSAVACPKKFQKIRKPENPALSKISRLSQSFPGSLRSFPGSLRLSGAVFGIFGITFSDFRNFRNCIFRLSEVSELHFHIFGFSKLHFQNCSEMHFRCSSPLETQALEGTTPTARPRVAKITAREPKGRRTEA